MKKNPIFVITMYLLIFINLTFYTYSNDVEKNRLFLINGNNRGISFVVNNNSDIVYTQVYPGEYITILKDKKTGEDSLICIERYGERKIVYYDYEEASMRKIYLDKEGNELNINNLEKSIPFVFNNYVIFNDYFSEIAPQYTSARIFDIINNKFLNNDNKFNIIVYENNNLFAKKIIPQNEKILLEYYLLDDDFNIMKKISEEEYENLNGKDYETCNALKEGELYVGEKHHLKYILDKDKKKLSNGYDCDILGEANFQKYANNIDSYNYDYNDILFFRTKNNKLTYFTLKGDIFTKSVPNDYDINGNIQDNLHKNDKIYNREYSLNETFVPGENNCYAILDNERKLAYVYDIRTSLPTATISSIMDNRSNENSDQIYRNIFYLDDVYLYNGYVMCHYYDIISDSYVTYMNIGTGEIGIKILNKMEIGKANPGFFIRKKSGEQYEKIMSLETGEFIKRPFFDYIDMKIFKCNEKTIFALQKEYSIDYPYDEVYDLYDNDFNLLYHNIQNIIQCGDLLSFVRKVPFERKELLENLNDDKIFNSYKVIINFDGELLFKSENSKSSLTEYNLHYNTGTKRGFIEETTYKIIDGNRERNGVKLYNSKKNIVLNNKYLYNYDIITSGIGFIFASNKEKTYIYDKNFKLYKTLNGYYRFSDYKGKFIVILNRNKNMEILIDSEFNFIGNECKYINFCEDYYYYLRGFKIYVSDYNHNILATVNYFSNFEDE